MAEYNLMVQVSDIARVSELDSVLAVCRQKEGHTNEAPDTDTLCIYRVPLKYSAEVECYPLFSMHRQVVLSDSALIDPLYIVDS